MQSNFEILANPTTDKITNLFNYQQNILVAKHLNLHHQPEKSSAKTSIFVYLNSVAHLGKGIFLFAANSSGIIAEFVPDRHLADVPAALLAIEHEVMGMHGPNIRGWTDAGDISQSFFREGMSLAISEYVRDEKNHPGF